jgi:hypothetical protein
MSFANNIFSDKDIYLKNLIIEKKENYIYNYPFLKDFLKNKKFIYKLDYDYFKNSPFLFSSRDLNKTLLITKIHPSPTAATTHFVIEIF